MKKILALFITTLQLSCSFSQIGSLDSDFSADGRVTHDFGFDEDMLTDMAIQSDGKIVAVGFTLDGSPGTAALLRYNPDGSLDNTFNGTGTLLPFSGFSGLFSVAVDNSGKIVAAGNRDFSNDIWVIRLLSNGNYDSTFSFDGQVVIDLGGVETTRDMLIQPDGKIVVCAASDNRPAFIRLNTDGTLDVSFSNDGKLTLSNLVNNSFGSIALQSSGKLVSAFANVDSSEITTFITRVNVNGTQDNTFATVGFLNIDLSPTDISSTLPANLIVDASDRLLIAGRTFTTTNPTAAGFVARLSANGSLDNSFNGDGVFIRAISKANRADAIASQSDGKYIVGFTIDTLSNANMEVIRLLTDGNTDGSFTDNSSFPPQTVQVDFASRNELLTSLLLQPNGRIVVGGRARLTSDVTSVQFAIARLLNDVDLTINNDISENLFRLYPNPTAGPLTIELNENKSRIVAVVLTNSLGEIVLLTAENQFSETDQNKSTLLLPSNITGGLYNVTIQLENGTTFNQRLIVYND
ncbi:MAG: T9SS type A sorting domain-containing protein [Bacteroidetes bacterium]|nr:T9SS type A sorting domain-containing protein [Bacteroidota bacterium]MBK8658222.1 T9SS type A sorting domain-containing protein [Bacteroidota bacterium]